MPTRNASATWEGGLKGGKGSFKGESGAIGASYSFGTRFENAPGSNPEELLAAAQAACFSMALALGLEQNGTPAERVQTSAACTVEKVGEGFQITTMKITTRVRAKGVERDKFMQIANATKDGCPVSKAFKGNMKMELDAALE